MPDPNESGFIVVECQTAPNQNNKRVCVPKTWVKCELREKRVAIAYPSEDEARIATRIKNKEPADDNWQLYIGEIKYEAESYQDAIIGFLKIRGENNKQTEDKNSKTEPVAVVAEPKNSLKLRIVVPKPKPKSEKKKKSIKKYMKEHSKDKINKSKHKSVKKQSLKENIPHQKNITERKTSSDSVDSEVATEIHTPGVPKPNCQSSTESVSKSLDSGIDVIMNGPGQSCLKQVNLNNNNSNTTKRSLSESLDVDLEREIDLSNANFSPKDKQFLMNLQIEQRETLANIKSVLLHLKTLYLKVHENKKTLDEIIFKYKDQPPPAALSVKVSKQNGNALEEENMQDDEIEHEADDEMESKDDDEMDNETEVNKQNHNTIIEEVNLLEEKDFERQDESDDQIFTDDESSLDSLPPPSPDVIKSKKNDNGRSILSSTWTLKHPHPGKGLVQLGGRSTGVYISAKGLEHAKLSCRNVRMFTRRLCKEVFTQEALKICSMTGRKPYVGKNKGLVRPPLHSHARTVILTYAMNYGREVGWEPVKLSLLVQSVRCMLHNSRRVRTKKTKKI